MADVPFPALQALVPLLGLAIYLLSLVGCVGAVVKLYRINKLTRLGGSVLQKKDVLAASDKEAIQRAAQSPDCPICDVLRDGESVGSII